MYLRCLVILAARPHDDISRRGTRISGLLVSVVTPICRFGKLEDGAGQAAEVTGGIGLDGIKQTSTSLLGEVGFLQNTLGGVDVWQIHDGSGVAGVEDGRETNTGQQGLHNVEVDLVVDNVAVLLMIDRVDDFVVAVILVAIEIFRLTSVTCRVGGKRLACEHDGDNDGCTVTNLNSGGTRSRRPGRS